MKKLIIIPFFIVCNLTFSQIRSIKFAPVVTLVGNTNRTLFSNKIFNSGIGGFVKYEQLLNKKMNSFIEVGIIHNKSKNVLDYKLYKMYSNKTFIPIIIGVNYLKIIDRFNIGMGLGLTPILNKGFENSYAFTTSPSISYDFNKISFNVSYNLNKMKVNYGSYTENSSNFIAFKLYFKIK
jgi:hypothetical protein